MNRPLSLLQHFDAPESYRGFFGWVCGYSADALFMDMAAERFSRQTHGQRARDGRPMLALMTDAHVPQVSMMQAPGVVHLPWQPNGPKPFRLQHAKIALLGYRHDFEVDLWKIRLIVSTGNWTQQTVEESLDLAFRVDLDAAALVDLRHDTEKQVCADIAAAWEVIRWLVTHYDARVLDAKRARDQVSLAGQARDAMSKWLDAAAMVSLDVPPRVFHNRQRSLLSQLPDLIRTHAGSDPRSYLAMGSGFYEGGDRADHVPVVLQAIRDRLVDEALLTGQSDIDVVVNPLACQAVAPAHSTMAHQGFRVRPAIQPDAFFGSSVRRTLHAKFLFGASHDGNNDLYGKPWLYLGSGNLTGPGFANPMSEHGGNLEVGVVFFPGRLTSKLDKKEPETFLGNRLPFNPEAGAFDAAANLQSGDDMPVHDHAYLAPPVAWLAWSDGCLHSPQSNDTDWHVLASDDTPLPSLSAGVFQWNGDRPRHARIEWPTANPVHAADLPVLDEFGRLGATELPALDVDEAIMQLLSFPMQPTEDRDGPDADEVETSMGGDSNREISAVADQPIRKLMSLIEEIAVRQAEVPQADWLAWCARLEQTLHQLVHDPNLQVFKQLEMNPLAPLRHQAFRPTYAEDATSNEGRGYEDTLSRVAVAWEVVGLHPLGVAP